MTTATETISTHKVIPTGPSVIPAEAGIHAALRVAGTAMYRHSEAAKRPKNLTLAFCVALAVHTLILFVGNAIIIQPAHFGVQSGTASMELSLVAGETALVQKPMVTPAETGIEPAKEEEQTPDQGNAPITAASAASEGAVWAEPQYVQNRPPRYPAVALRNGIEGTSILVVEIDEKGKASKVSIETSSGDTSLDRSAVQAVKNWIFEPARAGVLAIRSKTRIPIRFKISDKRSG